QRGVQFLLRFLDKSSAHRYSSFTEHKNLFYDTDCHKVSMLTLGPRYTILSIALFIGMVFSFCTHPMVVKAATYSESPAIAPSTPVDENVAADDDPDPNLVPLDTEGPTTDVMGNRTTPTSSVPRAEDLLELNQGENAPATARFSDAFNPPAELS